MFIFYVDEFGDHSLRQGEDGGLKPGVSDFFVLAAVGVRDTSRKPLAETIYDIKLRHFGPSIASRKWGDSELKGRYLFRVARSAASGHTLREPTAYRALDSPDKVNALIADLARVFRKFNPMIFTVAVDKKRMLQARSAYHPLGVAYAYLHQRVAMSMEDIFVGEGAIFVADQQAQHETYFRSGDMNAVREKITRPLARHPDFRLVLDKTLWIDTDYSSWDREVIQLADIAAYAAGECMIRNTAPREASYLWDSIRPCLATHWASGSPASGGFAIHPKPTKYPDI